MPNNVIGKIGDFGADVNQKLLTAREAAEQLGMSESWLRTSDVPFVRFGGRARRYRPQDLRSYTAAHVSHSIDRGAL